MRPGTKRVTPRPKDAASSGRMLPRHQETWALPPMSNLPSQVNQPLVMRSGFFSLAPGFSPVFDARELEEAVSTALCGRETAEAVESSFTLSVTGLKPG